MITIYLPQVQVHASTGKYKYHSIHATVTIRGRDIAKVFALFLLIIYAPILHVPSVTENSGAILITLNSQHDS